MKWRRSKPARCEHQWTHAGEYGPWVVLHECDTCHWQRLTNQLIGRVRYYQPGTIKVLAVTR